MRVPLQNLGFKAGMVAGLGLYLFGTQAPAVLPISIEPAIADYGVFSETREALSSYISEFGRSEFSLAGKVTVAGLVAGFVAAFPVAYSAAGAVLGYKLGQVGGRIFRGRRIDGLVIE